MLTAKKKNILSKTNLYKQKQNNSISFNQMYPKNSSYVLKKCIQMSLTNKKKAVSNSSESLSDPNPWNKCFREILSKESRIYYDKKMEANKNGS